MPTRERIRVARMALLMLLIAAGVFVLGVMAQPTPAPPTQPAGEVGSGLHLPLGGGR